MICLIIDIAFFVVSRKMAFYNERSKNIQVFKEYVIKSMLDNFFKDVKYLYNEGKN